MLAELVEAIGNVIADLSSVAFGSKGSRGGDVAEPSEQERESNRRTLWLFLVAAVALGSLFWYALAQVADGLGQFFDAPWWGPSGTD